MQNTALQTAIDELIALNEFGRYAEMEARASSLAKSFPGVPVVRELLGMALAAQQRFADALPHFKRAVRAEPGDPLFWDNLAFCQLQLGQLEAAEATLRDATARHPGSLSAWTALANVRFLRGRLDEARDALSRVFATHPDDPGTHFMAARIAMTQRRFDQAQDHLHAALAVDPNNGALHAELGKLLLWAGNLPEAEARLRHAIAFDASDPACRANLCRVLALMGDLDSATVEARLLLDQLRTDGGGISDRNVEYFDVVAGIFGGGAKVGEALDIYRAALRVRKEPLRALSASLLARKACDWAFAAELESLACEVANEGNAIDETVPFRLLWLESATPQVQLAAAGRIGRLTANAVAPAVREFAPRDRDRLRVGYYSGDLFSHPVGHLIAGVIESHDRARFEIVAYDFSAPIQDDYRERLEHAFERMVGVGELSHEIAAQRIADDQPDIIVDLNGWIRRERATVMAARPAPLQVQWLGFAGTLGAPWIDYIVADPVVIPSEHEHHFSEKILRLPDTMMPTDDKCPTIPGLSRASYGLPQDALVFCSFNGSFKITPELFEIWMQLLNSVPNSVLWLAAQIPEAVEAMRRFAAERGVAPERLVFATMLPAVAEHLARIPLADIALDCFPYGSHTTSADCMRAGVPLVGLMGDTFASRVSASVLGAAGLPELIARNFDEYRALAMRLATQRDELAALRLRMRQLRNDAPLFDTGRFTRHLEAAFEAIWARHCQGQSPDHINVEPAGRSVVA
jgi:predicted O-linked N-acetylglucosamine transferase (SPINDLY family)